MAVNKNFVVKNGFEVNSDLILANALTKNVGIGSSSPKYKLDVAGGIGATTLNVIGIGTIATFRSGSGIITTISGTNLNYSGISTISNLNGDNLNYTGICTIGTISVTSSAGTNLDYTGVSTISGVKIFSGIVTSSSISGIVTYYGDGSKLTNVGGSPSGSNTTIQYNSAGFFAGSTNFTYNGTNVTLSGGTFVGNLSGNVTGNLTGNADTSTTATNANNINIVASTSSDTTTSVVLVNNQATGFQTAFIDSGLQYNAVTDTLSATTFSGSLSGNATSATTATNANNINISAITSADTLTSVVLVASQSTGNQSPFIDSGLTYDASTDTLFATTFSGNLSGNATSATTATNAQGLTGTPNITVGTINATTVTGTGFVDDGVNLLDAINEKPSTGKTIVMSMIFG